jgi:hypothetical protein
MQLDLDDTLLIIIDRALQGLPYREAAPAINQLNIKIKEAVMNEELMRARIANEKKRADDLAANPAPPPPPTGVAQPVQSTKGVGDLPSGNAAVNDRQGE